MTSKPTTSPDPNIHLDDTWLPTFTKLRLTAFGQSVIAIANNPDFDDWTFSQKIAHAIDVEVAARTERRIMKLLKASKSPNLDACVEELNYHPDRNLNRESIARLAHCQWITDTRNVVILGASSVGKTYLALALLNAACRNDNTALFYRTNDLISQLAVLEPTDPQRLEFLTKLHDVDLLVLDDFLTTPIDGHAASDLFNIIAAREQRGSTLVTSQQNPEQWYQSIPDKVIAESLLNRLVGDAEIINLTGPNMRLNPTTN